MGKTTEPENGGRSGIAGLEDVDILVGIPSFNNAGTIGHVVRAVEAGLTKYFPGRHAVLVNSDGGSSDGTADVVRDASLDLDSILLDHRKGGFRKLVTPYEGQGRAREPGRRVVAALRHASPHLGG